MKDMKDMKNMKDIKVFNIKLQRCDLILTLLFSLKNFSILCSFLIILLNIMICLFILFANRFHSLEYVISLIKTLSNVLIFLFLLILFIRPIL